MTSADGAQDLYVGTKLALTEQKGVLPAVAVIPQMTLPTGSRAVTAGKILPGLNIDCGWELIKNFFGIELLIANNLVTDDVGGTRHEFSTGLTSVVQVTKRLEAFVEWDAFYTFAGAGSVGPRHYAVGGVYFITPNFEVDVRVGVRAQPSLQRLPHGGRICRPLLNCSRRLVLRVWVACRLDQLLADMLRHEPCWE
jgi:hypothetical protein